jgi:threonine aldolase
MYELRSSMKRGSKMRTEEIVDLRSDTVTLPTEEMLEAIRHVELGDDVFGEDPTVTRLEKLAAEMMDKEAALLVSSGTQANLISLMSNTNRGELVILESESHIYWYEVGGISMIAGLLPWPLKSRTGALDPKDVEAAIRPENIHFPEPALVCIENTHNRHGGTVITPEQIQAIREAALTHGLKLYMDGARIFNAAVSLNVDVKDLTKHVDNLMFCLSKSLSCPIGSLVVGTQEFVEKARKLRKVLGGGMRQAGIIAAPGIVALEKMIDRLKEDHENAKRLAEGIAKIDGINIDLGHVQTNIVCFDISGLGIADDLFLSKLKKAGILTLMLAKNIVRMVTHRGIEKNHIEKTIATIENISNEIHVGLN